MPVEVEEGARRVGRKVLEAGASQAAVKRALIPGTSLAEP